MKIAIVSRDEAAQKLASPCFGGPEFELSSDPQYVIVVGGDGTLLRAERLHPGVPKALIKSSSVGKLFTDHTATQVAHALRSGKFSVREQPALEAFVHGETYRAANDVIIRNKHLTQAIRFTVDVPGHFFDGDFIGDGLVISTPMGSKGYFHTITRKNFDSGIGIAFNNVVQLHDLVPLLKSDAVIQVNITRGPAQLGVDNSLHSMELHQGDIVTVKESTIPVRLVVLEDPK